MCASCWSTTSETAYCILMGLRELILVLLISLRIAKLNCVQARRRSKTRSSSSRNRRTSVSPKWIQWEAWTQSPKYCAVGYVFQLWIICWNCTNWKTRPNCMPTIHAWLSGKGSVNQSDCGNVHRVHRVATSLKKSLNSMSILEILEKSLNFSEKCTMYPWSLQHRILSLNFVNGISWQPWFNRPAKGNSRPTYCRPPYPSKRKLLVWSVSVVITANQLLVYPLARYAVCRGPYFCNQLSTCTCNCKIDKSLIYFLGLCAFSRRHISQRRSRLSCKRRCHGYQN